MAAAVPDLPGGGRLASVSTEWISRALSRVALGLLLVLVGPPAYSYWLLFDHLPYRWRVRKLVAGGPEVAWLRLVEQWERSDCVYGSMVGPELASRIENDGLEAYVARYKEPEAHCFRSLSHPNPYVCAYALRAICRLRATQDRSLDRSEVPAELLARTDSIEQQWACQGWTTSLGEYAEGCLTQDWPRPGA